MVTMMMRIVMKRQNYFIKFLSRRISRGTIRKYVNFIGQETNQKWRWRRDEKTFQFLPKRNQLLIKSELAN